MGSRTEHNVPVTSEVHPTPRGGRWETGDTNFEKSEEKRKSYFWSKKGAGCFGRVRLKTDEEAGVEPGR